jgi:radical SAM protein with 4Fe4S-binding SPASM domain
MKPYMEDAMLYGLEEVCLEVTNKCLSNCVHCSSSASRAGLPIELTLGEIKDLIDQAAILSISPLPGSAKDLHLDEFVKLMPVLRQELSEKEWEDAVTKEIIRKRQEKKGKPVLELSGGEPILHPDIYEIARYGKKKGFRIKLYTAAIAQRGKGITAEDVEQWANILDKDDEVIISVEGATEKTHEDMTKVKGHFRIVMDAIDLFQRHSITVTAHCTPTKINYKEIPDLVDLLDEKLVREVAFLRLVPQGRALKNLNKLMLTREEFMELQEIITEEWRVREQHPHPEQVVKVRCGCPIDFRHLLYPVDKRPCHGGRDTIVVRPDGSLHPCPAWKGISKMTLGNIREDSLRSIWLDSEVLDLFRNFTPDDLQGECHWCSSKMICGGGCPAQRILSNINRGIIDKRALLAVGPDPLCFKDLL